VYKVSLGGVIESAITGLSPEEQLELVKGIGKHLVNQGQVSETVSSPSFPCLQPAPLVKCNTDALQLLDCLNVVRRR
jgi:hypothetical protein